MPDFPAIFDRLPQSVFSTADPSVSVPGDYVSVYRATYSSATWPTANKAALCPVTLSTPATINRLFCYNGTAVSGNIDVGLYDINLNRLVSTGGVAQAGVSAPQVFSVGPITIAPGDYYLALALDNIVGTIFRASTMGAGMLTALNVLALTSAGYPLPLSASAAVGMNSGLFPFIGALASGTVI